MPLTRKARIVGSSLVITIPSQLAKAHDINDGDELEIIPTINRGIQDSQTKKIRKLMLHSLELPVHPFEKITGYQTK